VISGLGFYQVYRLKDYGPNTLVFRKLKLLEVAFIFAARFFAPGNKNTFLGSRSYLVTQSANAKFFGKHSLI
jgi:hypothetical protein